MEYKNYYSQPAGKPHKYLGPVFLIAAPVFLIALVILIRWLNPTFADEGLFTVISALTFHQRFYSSSIYDGLYAGTVLALIVALSSGLLFLFSVLMKKQLKEEPQIFLKKYRLQIILILLVIYLGLCHFLFISPQGAFLGFGTGFSLAFYGCLTVGICLAAAGIPALLIEACVYNFLIRIRTFYIVLILSALGLSIWYSAGLLSGQLSWTIPQPAALYMLLCSVFYGALFFFGRFGPRKWNQAVYLRPVRFAGFLVLLYFSILFLYYVNGGPGRDSLWSLITAVIWFLLSWFCMEGLAGHISMPRNSTHSSKTSSESRAITGIKAIDTAYLCLGIVCLVLAIEMFLGL